MRAVYYELVVGSTVFLRFLHVAAWVCTFYLNACTLFGFIMLFTSLRSTCVIGIAFGLDLSLWLVFSCAELLVMGRFDV